MLTGILDNRDDLRVAVVVNDVASVNVDGAVIRKELVGVDETEVELLELQLDLDLDRRPVMIDARLGARY